eukprot:m.248062 g.248062  ORF g.248062 m.248062 type:complete len:145 (+) comp17160_c0_seq7:171-605(+)
MFALGMGEGTGSKDVSKEIENEEQVQGLKDEQQEPPPEDGVEEEENGLEMENDFDAEMYDRERGEEDNDDEDELDEEDLEQQMGDLQGADAETLDHGMWAGEFMEIKMASSIGLDVLPSLNHRRCIVLIVMYMWIVIVLVLVIG